jgi:hypothetical protein
MRPYTGNKDGVSKKKREGLEHLVACIAYLSGGKLKNNGTLVIRNARGKDSLSVHATGRAADLSYRGGSRTNAVAWMELLVRHADELGLEYLADYAYTKGLGGGRGWKCDRGTWADYKKGQIEGGGQSWADWFHIELSPAMVDDKAAIQAAVDRIVSELQAAPLEG